MKKIIGLLSSILLMLCIISCSKETTTLSTLQTTTDTELTTTALIDKYEEFGLTYGTMHLFESTLIPVQAQNDLWGYINIEGEMVIEPIFGSVTSFDEYGHAIVYIDYGPTVIDMDGNILISKSYDYINIYSDYILCTKSWSDGTRIYDIYDYDGNILMENVEDIDLVYEQYPKEHQGTWYIDQSDDGKLGLVNNAGEPISEYLYDDIRFTYRPNFVQVGINKLYGIIKSTGDIIVEPIYTNRVQFGNYFFFSDIAAIVTEEGLLGFVDCYGEIIIEPQFDVSNYENIRDYEVLFYHGVQMVPDGDTQYIIDLKGNILFELPDDAYAITDYDDEIISYTYNYVEGAMDNNVRVIDYEGNILYEGTNQVIRLTYDNSDVFFALEYFHLPQEGIPGVDATMYNYAGEVLKDNFSMVFNYWDKFWHLNFINGYMDFIDNATETIGFMDKTGATVIEPQFGADRDVYKHLNNLMFHSDGYAVVMKDGLYGIIDSEGNVVVDFLYLKIKSNLYN